MARKNGRGILQGYLDDFLACRGHLHHSWSEAIDDGRRLRKWRETNTNRRYVFVCGRCKTARYMVWNRFTGEVLAVTYDYPEGYKLAGNVQAKSLRKEFMERTKDKVRS